MWEPSFPSNPCDIQLLSLMVVLDIKHFSLRQACPQTNEEYMKYIPNDSPTNLSFTNRIPSVYRLLGQRLGHQMKFWGDGLSINLFRLAVIRTANQIISFFPLPQSITDRGDRRLWVLPRIYVLRCFLNFWVIFGEVWEEIFFSKAGLVKFRKIRNIMKI